MICEIWKESSDETFCLEINCKTFCVVCMCNNYRKIATYANRCNTVYNFSIDTIYSFGIFCQIEILK